MTKNEIEQYKINNIVMSFRGQHVIIAQDLARLFGVETKVFNQAVKRNLDRFPDDFVFQLNKQEFNELVTNCDRFKSQKHSYVLPYAFTEHGAVMASMILNSPSAVEMSIYVVRAFVAMRSMSKQISELTDKINELDKKYIQHDEVLRLIGEILFPTEEAPSLPAATPDKKKKIGFTNKKK